MDNDNSFYKIGGGLAIVALVLWELQRGAVFISVSGTIHRGYIYRDAHPKIFWFLIIFELFIAACLFHSGHFKKE